MRTENSATRRLSPLGMAKMQTPKTTMQLKAALETISEGPSSSASKSCLINAMVESKTSGAAPQRAIRVKFAAVWFHTRTTITSS